MERFKNRWFEHGTGKGRTEERIQVDGRSAYRLKDIANLAGEEMHRADTVVIERGKLYQIDAIGVGADPMNDSAVLNCVNSFRFLTQMASSVNKPLPVERTDKLPERVADITFAVLIGLIAIFVVVKIVKKRR